MILEPAVAEKSRAGGASMGRVVRHGACVAMVALTAAAAVAPIATAQSPPVVFTPTGAEQSYVVPADVSQVSIEAIGAPGGGACGGGTGGLGARVTAELAVSPGSVLYVEVGAIGAPGVLPSGICVNSSPSVFNGGGALGVVGGGGGGGASDVRTVPRAEAGSLGSRLIVAAGGGGAGSGGSVPGGAGGNAGSAGGGPVAGGGATLTGPGSAGAPDPSCTTNATSGAFGVGGAGANDFPNNGGGGGGGGYWGGGGGGCLLMAGYGGGGGSSYVAPHAINVSPVTTTAAPPSVTITPIEAAPLPQGPPGPAGPPGPVGPQGPAGPVVTIERLILAAFDDRLRARPRARVTLRYIATASAAVELAILRGRRTVARIRGRAKAGRNTLRLRAPRAAGRYTLALEARADNRSATERVRLTVSRPRR
jgi:Glycine rich protein